MKTVSLQFGTRRLSFLILLTACLLPVFQYHYEDDFQAFFFSFILPGNTLRFALFLLFCISPVIILSFMGNLLRLLIQPGTPPRVLAGTLAGILAVTAFLFFTFNLVNYLVFEKFRFYLQWGVFGQFMNAELPLWIKHYASLNPIATLWISSVLVTAFIIFYMDHYYFLSKISSASRHSTRLPALECLLILLLGILFQVPSIHPYYRYLKRHPLLVFLESAKKSSGQSIQSEDSIRLKQQKREYYQSLAMMGASWEQKPHVFLFIVESLRTDALFDGTRLKDPALDVWLASGGLTVPALTSQSPETSGSIQAIFTGVYPYKIRFIHDLPQLHEIFDQLGYRVFLGGFERNWKGLHELFQIDATEKILNIPAESITHDDWLFRKMELWISENSNSPLCGLFKLNDTHFTRRDPSSGNIHEVYHDAVDLAVKRLVRFRDFLDSAGILEQSLVIVTSDHGESLMEHGLFYHGNSVYQEAIAVPFLLFKKGFPLVTLSCGGQIDILPTMLDLAGIPVPPGLDGRSLADEQDAERFLVSWLDYAGLICLVRKPHVFIENIHIPGQTELHHLENDPRQENNLSGRNPEVEEKFRDHLATLLRDHF